MWRSLFKQRAKRPQAEHIPVSEMLNRLASLEQQATEEVMRLESENQELRRVLDGSIDVSHRLMAALEVWEKRNKSLEFSLDNYRFILQGQEDTCEALQQELAELSCAYDAAQVRSLN